MTITIISAVLLIAGLITEFITAATAPFGYQDESGFHFGHDRPPARNESESEFSG